MGRELGSMTLKGATSTPAKILEFQNARDKHKTSCTDGEFCQVDHANHPGNGADPVSKPQLFGDAQLWRGLLQQGAEQVVMLQVGESVRKGERVNDPTPHKCKQKPLSQPPNRLWQCELLATPRLDMGTLSHANLEVLEQDASPKTQQQVQE